MKTLEQRVEDLEKSLADMKISLDSIKRLIDTQYRMTVTEAGRKGGSVKGIKKGPSAMSPERRAEILAKARAMKAQKASEK